jgi:hypothetical protein
MVTSIKNMITLLLSHRFISSTNRTDSFKSEAILSTNRSDSFKSEAILSNYDASLICEVITESPPFLKLTTVLETEVILLIGS